MIVDLYPNWLAKDIDQYKLPKEMSFDFYPDFDKVFVYDTLKGYFTSSAPYLQYMPNLI